MNSVDNKDTITICEFNDFLKHAQRLGIVIKEIGFTKQIHIQENETLEGSEPSDILMFKLHHM